MRGKLVLELPVVKQNPLNANGAFVRLRSGGILFAYNRLLARHNDSIGAEIAGVISHDQGLSWSSPATLLATSASDSLRDISNVSFMRLADGRLAVFYSVLRKSDDLRMYSRISGDEGLTWTGEALCMQYPGFFSVNNDRVVRLSSGRLIIPAAYHDQLQGSGDDPDAAGERVFTSIDFSGACHFFLSDDDGQTWRIAPGMVASSVPHSVTGLQEPGIVELSPGVLWGFARTDLGRHYEFFSFDGGLTWTQAQPSRFTGPCSPLAIKRGPSGLLVAVWNPVPSYISQTFDRPRFQRSRLVYAVSADNSNTWQTPVILEDESAGDYTHPAIHFADGATLIAYNATFGQEVKSGTIRIRRIAGMMNCE